MTKVVPKSILETLICLNCKCFLSIFPIYSKIGNSSNPDALCGRCKITEKDKYLKDVAYEELAQFLIFPCRYVQNGCKIQSTPLKLEEHEYFCEFRNIDCPSKDFVKCNWTDNKAKLAAHFEEKHTKMFLKEPCFELSFDASQEECFLFMQEKEMFTIIKEVDSKKGYFACSVEHLKANEESESYNFTLKIESEDKNYNFKCPDFGGTDNEKLKIIHISKQNLEEKLFNAKTYIVNVILTKSVSKVDMIVETDISTEERTSIPKKNQQINWELLAQLECPVCMEYMLPPIRQCIGGHSLCEGCTKNLKECPQCRKAFQETRNFAMENITQFLHYPCKFYKNGCDSAFKTDDIKTHEETCKYGPSECPIKHIQSCDWKGHTTEIAAHIENNHNETILQNSRVDVSYDQLLTITKTFIIKFNKKYFKVDFKHKEKIFYWCVQLIGSKTESKKFKFEIDLIDLNKNGKRFYLSETVFPLMPQSECFVNKGTYIFTTLEQIEAFLQNSISFRVGIIKSD